MLESEQTQNEQTQSGQTQNASDRVLDGVTDLADLGDLTDPRWSD